MSHSFLRLRSKTKSSFFLVLANMKEQSRGLLEELRLDSLEEKD